MMPSIAAPYCLRIADITCPSQQSASWNVSNGLQAILAFCPSHSPLLHCDFVRYEFSRPSTMTILKPV